MELVVWGPSHRREHRRHKEVETHRTIPAGGWWSWPWVGLRPRVLTADPGLLLPQVYFDILSL